MATNYQFDEYKTEPADHLTGDYHQFEENIAYSPTSSDFQDVNVRAFTPDWLNNADDVFQDTDNAPRFSSVQAPPEKCKKPVPSPRTIIPNETRFRPVQHDAVPQPTAADLPRPSLSPEFLQARDEALYLGLQGEQLANYVLAKTKPNPVQVSSQHVSQNVSGPKIRLERWKIKEEMYETFIHRFERLASDLD